MGVHNCSSYYASRYAVPDEEMTYACLSGHYTLAEVGSWFGDQKWKRDQVFDL